MSALRSIVALSSILLIAGAQALGQGPARGRIEAPRDPILEIEAKHNLSVAKWYLSKRKAYEGARDRLQEIIDTYPEFSRMDEVLFYMGDVHQKLGKDDDALGYYRKLLEEFPGSDHAKKTRERVERMEKDGATKPDSL